MRGLIFISIILIGLASGEDVTKIDITFPPTTKPKVGVLASATTDSNYKKKIDKIFLSDFKLSGHFTSKSVNKAIDFNSKPINVTGADYILVYDFKNKNGTITLRAKLFNKNYRKIMDKILKVSNPKKLPFLIHRVVSSVNKIKNYSPIDWINNYVILSRYIGPKQTEIILADYSFTYRKTIIKGGLNIFPKWADRDQTSFYYSNYSRNILKLYRLNIHTGERELIFKARGGVLFCSDVSSDYSKLLLTLAQDGEPDIYLFQNGLKRRLTNYRGIDVSGKFADNDKTLVFVSNRFGGRANIFKKPIAGGGVKRLLSSSERSSSCDTHNSMVIYSKSEGGSESNIYLTTTDAIETKALTEGGKNQFPRFSSDGKVVMYIKRTAKGSKIGFINIGSGVGEVFDLGISRIQSIDW